jgi:deoxyribodipyrimidine photo-lyase
MPNQAIPDDPTTGRPILVWFRQDLRLADNPALSAAAEAGPVLALCVLDDDGPGRWRIGGASRWWLHGSLTALGQALARHGVPLTVARGPAAATVAGIAREAGASAVHVNACAEPSWRLADQELTRLLAGDGIAMRSFDGATLFPLGRIVGSNGRMSKVFTPFWRACLAAPPPSPPLPVPPTLRGPAAIAGATAGDALDDWDLRPSKPDWAGGLRAAWQPGEAAALQRLAAYVDHGLNGYARHRDRPEPTNTSRLSPSLHWGEISPRQAWHAARIWAAAEPALAADAESFLREVGWREFYANILVEQPDAPEQPLQAAFHDFPWAADPHLLRAWQRGRTGYPLVDAGMRELWHTGWMHNRVRMITASFLTKHLLQPWQDGEAWFWDTLVDADLASNSGGWQWVAGCGTDAAPYFRIFNPVAQGERFDADGAYIRRWLPQLAQLPARLIHRPWEATPLELAAAGVRLGVDYPNRLVEHGAARTRALDAFARRTSLS